MNHRGGSPETGIIKPPPDMVPGVDRVLAAPEDFPRLFNASRVGLVSSRRCRTALFWPPASNQRRQIDSDRGVPVPDALLAGGVSLTRLFGPEHGFSGGEADGSPVLDGTDAPTGLPVESLYGPRLEPDPASVTGLDLVIFDLQDVGARFYTFLWTLSLILESCSDVGVPVLVLDRPNPIGGDPVSVEGPVQDTPARSGFLGRWPIPVRHSLTVGELALLLKGEMGLDTDLQVVPARPWQRDHHWPDTGLPFHPPSPGIPSYESALFYPGTALLEATNVLEGRGTPLAFRWLGAPWIDPQVLAREICGLSLPGVGARARSLQLPGGGTCPGVALHAEDPKAVRPVATGLHLLVLLRTLWPSKFRWVAYPTHANVSGSDHLLLLLGRPEIASALENTPVRELVELIQVWTEPGDWWVRAQPHLLYESGT